MAIVDIVGTLHLDNEVEVDLKKIYQSRQMDDCDLRCQMLECLRGS